MRNKLLTTIFIGVVVVAGYWYFTSNRPFNFTVTPPEKTATFKFSDQALAANFDSLSKNGNSSCSANFQEAVRSGSTGKDRLMGSCCSPMDPHRYSEQIEGLKKYSYVAKIPPDPYDIDAVLAQKLMSDYETQLTPDEQKAYDYAMQNSMEKGPCCCKCWRWYVYGGLGKLLIQKYHFTGEQVTEVWNLSDGCGGPGDHVEHL